MNPNDQEFQKQFVNSLGTEVVSLGSDLSEIGVDALITSTPGILQSLPIAGAFVALGKAGLALRDYKFAKKILQFINEVNRGNLRNGCVIDLKASWEKNPKEMSKIIENVGVILDRQFSERQAQILAGVFVGYSSGKVNWDEFMQISFGLEKLNPVGYDGLLELWEEQGHARSYFKERRNLPLKINVLTGCDFVNYENSTYGLNRLGEILVKYGFVEN